MDEDRFYELINEWADSSRSDLGVNFECRAYQALVEIGPQSFRPLDRFYDNQNFLKEEYSSVRSNWVLRLMGEVIDEGFSFLEDLSGKVDEIEAFTRGLIKGYLVNN